MLEGGPSSLAQSPYARSEALSRAKAVARRHAATVSPLSPLCQDHLLFVHSRHVPSHRFSKPPPPGPRSGRRCAAARRSLRSSTNCARAPRASSPRPPPPASLSSWRHGRLSSVRGVLDPSLSQRDRVCSGRCLPEASLASHLPPWRYVSEDLYPLTGLWRAQAQVCSYRATLFEAVGIFQCEHEGECGKRSDSLDLAQELGFWVMLFRDGFQLALVVADALRERSDLLQDGT